MLSLPLGARSGSAFMPRDAVRVLHASLRPLIQPAPPVSEPAAAIALTEPAARVAAPEQAPAPAPAVEAVQPSGTVPIAATYFKASQLTEIPRPLTEPPLEPIERMLGGAGGMRMIVYIDEWGAVTAVDVQSATLPQPVVAQAAAIFSNVRFSPGRIGQFAVKSQIGIDLGAAPVAAQSSYGN